MNHIGVVFSFLDNFRVGRVLLLLLVLLLLWVVLLICVRLMLCMTAVSVIMATVTTTSMAIMRVRHATHLQRHRCCCTPAAVLFTVVAMNCCE